MLQHVKSVPSRKCGELTDPNGKEFDLFPVVVIPTENSRGELLVLCRASVKDGSVPCNVPNIAAVMAKIIKELGGGEGLEMKVVGPFEIPVDPCCQATAEKAPEQLAPAKPKRPSRPRKAAAKKPARRRR